MNIDISSSVINSCSDGEENCTNMLKGHLNLSLVVTNVTSTFKNSEKARFCRLVRPCQQPVGSLPAPALICQRKALAGCFYDGNVLTAHLDLDKPVLLFVCFIFFSQHEHQTGNDCRPTVNR